MRSNKDNGTRHRFFTAAVSCAIWAALVGPARAGEDADGGATPAMKWGGYTQGEVAYTYRSPVHWSKLKARLELAGEGRFTEDLKWKLSAGAWYDAVFDITDFYPTDVANDQRTNFIAREVFLD